MRVAVIGAGGFVGKHICLELMARGVDVLPLSAGGPGGIALETGLLPLGFTFPQGVEAVYFLAQSPRYREMPEQSVHLLSVNCLAVAQAADAARKADVAKFVYASTGNVYVPSFSPHAETSPTRRDDWYSLSKVMAEDVLALYRPCFDVTIARIFGVYGPCQQADRLVPVIADSVRLNRELYVDRNPTDDEDLDGLRVSLIYIADLVDAMLKLLTVNCEVVNLAGSEAVSIRRLANVLGASLGVEPRIAVSTEYRDADLIADVRIYEHLLGLPKVPLEEGVARFLAAGNAAQEIRGK